MEAADGGNETWLKRRFGPSSWQAMPPSRRASWIGVGLAGSLVLLGAFWLVLHQAKERAQQHWSQVSRPEQGEPCGPSRLDDAVCAPATGRPAAARAGTAPR